MSFEILGEITEVEAMARGSGIRDLARLRRIYGRGNWRKVIRNRAYQSCKREGALGRIALARGSRHRQERNQAQALSGLKDEENARGNA
jgi:hypothetical protein